MANESYPVSVKLTPEEYDRWKDCADREKRSMSSLIRVAVELYIRNGEG